MKKFALSLALLAATLPLLAHAGSFSGRDYNGVQIYWSATTACTSGSPCTSDHAISDGTNRISLETALSDTQGNTENRLPTSSYMLGWDGTTNWVRLLQGKTGTLSSFSGLHNTMPYGIYHSSPITLTDGQGAPVQLDANGHSLSTINAVSGGLVDGSLATIGTKTDNKSTATDTTSTSAMSLLKEMSAMLQAPPSQPVTAVSSGIADGALVTVGTKTDAKNTATDATSLTIMQVLKQISASVQAPPSQPVTNVGTFAVQATLQAASGVDIGKLTLHQSVNVDQVNGTTTDTNSGTKSAGTQRMVIATDQPSLTNPIPVSQSTASNLNAQVVGATAAGSANAGNPLKIGAVARTADQTTATTGNITDLTADKRGILVMQPWALAENTVTGATTDITNTTATSVIAAAGAGIKNYIKSIMIMNSHATVGTWVNVTDGSGGTILFTGYAGAAGGGFTYYPEPAVPGTANTAVYCQDVTTGANVRCNVTVYKGP